MALTMEYSLAQYDEKFWREFIELYASLPELWQTKHPHYKCNPLKERAYQILVNKLKEVDQNAGTFMVRSKITALRAYYRKEVKKIEKCLSKNPSNIILQTYEPGWMFHALDFLRYQVNLYETIDCGEQDEKSPSLANKQMQIGRPNLNQHFGRIPPDFNQFQEISESEIDVIIRGWYYEFRKLSPDQKIFAKRAIYDILFEAQLCGLHKNSITFNQSNPMVHPTLRHMSGGSCFSKHPVPINQFRSEFNRLMPVESNISPEHLQGDYHESILGMPEIEDDNVKMVENMPVETIILE